MSNDSWLRQKTDKFVEDLFKLLHIKQERAQNNRFVSWVRVWYSLIEHVYKFLFNWGIMLIIFYFALYYQPHQAALIKQANIGCDFACLDVYNATGGVAYLNDTDIYCRCGRTTDSPVIRPNGEGVLLDGLPEVLRGDFNFPK